jgi:broad specificity phosphatase PhoE
MTDPDVVFITHPNVAIDPGVPVPEWSLSERGRERMRVFAARELARSFRCVVSSTEQKAVESAAFLAEACGVAPLSYPELGENDRSSTGYMPKAEFEATADRFFAAPDESVRGWERARDAQARIVGAVTRVLSTHGSLSPLAIVAHGGVGTLLLCHLLGEPIRRTRDQPGSEGGNYFRFGGRDWSVEHAWRAIDPD